MTGPRPTSDRRDARIRHVLQAAALLGLVWTGIVVQTGGFATSVLGLRVSSTNPRGPGLVVVLLVLGAVWWSRPAVSAAWLADVRMVRDWCRRWPWPFLPSITVAAALWLAALLLAQWFWARPLWLDEQMIALNIRERTMAQMMGGLWLDQAAPLGWLILQRVVWLVLGERELALRLLPVLNGCGVIIVAIWIGRRWLGHVATLCLTLLAGASQWVSYYSTELKPYSGDVFWAFWLPAFAVWAIEAPEEVTRRRRILRWWAAAAVGQVLAFGALFAAPSAALFIILHVWRRSGVQEVLRNAGGALVWLVAVGGHYFIAIRHASANQSLATYWSWALAPESAGSVGVAAWLVDSLGHLAVKPGGTSYVALFWVVAAIGWLRGRQPLGCLMAAIPVTATILALLRLVPLFERLALWTVPAMLVGIALAVDWAVRSWRNPISGPRSAKVGLHALTLLASLVLVVDMIPRGLRELDRDAHTNHSLNDKAGIEWLLTMHRTGDVIVTTELALPALWWYGRVPVGAPALGARLQDGSPIVVARWMPERAACADQPLAKMASAPRILVYLGFRFDDVPPGFDQALFDTLGRIGNLVSVEDLPGVGRAALIEPGLPQVMPRLTPRFSDEPASPSGCIEFVPARRW